MNLQKEYQSFFKKERHPNTFWFKKGIDPSVSEQEIESFEIPQIKVSYSNNYKNKFKLTSANDAYGFFMKSWDNDLLQYQEEVKLMLLDNANNVLGILDLAKGGMNDCVVDIRIIFSVALKCNASSIILAHNHPSGTLKPSISDIEVTNTVIKIGKELNIKLLDHFIVTTNGAFSIINGASHYEEIYHRI